MSSTQVICPKCGSENIKNAGYSSHNVPRYRCCNDECEIKTFVLKYRYKAYEPGIKEQAVDMAINGSGIKDERMHDIVIGLLINKIEFGVNIHEV